MPVPRSGSTRGAGRQPQEQLLPSFSSSSQEPQTPQSPAMKALEGRLVKVGHALMQLRFEFVEIVKLVQRIECTGREQHAFGPPLQPSIRNNNAAAPPSLTDCAPNENVALLISSVPSTQSCNAKAHGPPDAVQSIETNEGCSVQRSLIEISPSKKRPLDAEVADIPSNMVKTFSLATETMDEVLPRRKRVYTRKEQKEVNQMRARGACADCRQGKRKCSMEHHRSLAPSTSTGRLQPLSRDERAKSPVCWGSATQSDTLLLRTPELPPLFAGHEIRRTSLPDLGEPLLNHQKFSAYRKTHGVPRTIGNLSGKQSSKQTQRGGPILEDIPRSMADSQPILVDTHATQDSSQFTFRDTVWSSLQSTIPDIQIASPQFSDQSPSTPKMIPCQEDNFGANFPLLDHLEEPMALGDQYPITEMFMESAKTNRNLKRVDSMSTSPNFAQIMPSLAVSKAGHQPLTDTSHSSIESQHQPTFNDFSKSSTTQLDRFLANRTTHGPSPGLSVSARSFPTHGRLSSPDEFNLDDFDWADIDFSQPDLNFLGQGQIGSI